MKTWLTKRGWAVAMPDGTYRGVFKDRRTASMIRTMAETLELCMFDRPTIARCRIPRWTRYGVHAEPLKEA